MMPYSLDYTCDHGEPPGDCLHDGCKHNPDTAYLVELDAEQDAKAASEQDEGDPDSWAPIDLGPYLRGEIKRPTPTIGIARNDGLRVLYPGREHAVIGEMESGKSWFASASAAAELLAGHHVVYVHFEESDPSDTIERLRAQGVPAPTIEKLFHFVAPQRQVSADALARLLDPIPTLVVLDGVNEGMSLHRQKIRDEDGAAEFRRCLVKPCTRTGAAVLMCDHVVKDEERRGRYAIGSIHKGNALTGALFVLENADPFGRGQRGRSHVYVTKDRPGHLRREGRPGKVPGKTLIGELVVDDQQIYTPDLELHFYATTVDNAPAKAASDPHGADNDTVLAAIKKITAKGKEPNLRAVRAVAKLRGTRTDDALERLKFDDRVAETSRGRARVFYVSQDVPEDPTPTLVP